MTTRVSLCLLLALCAYSRARSTGPPIDEVMDVCTDMRPRHNGTGMNSTPPVEITLEPSRLTYGVGEAIILTITARPTQTFRGFMVQARTSDGNTLGGFRNVISNETRTQFLDCFNTDDTAAHSTADDFTSISIEWIAPSSRVRLETITFYYTVVQDYSTFWVRQPSHTVQPVESSCKRKLSSSGRSNLDLVRAHGSVMTIAWGLLAPVGILLALFYKVVWPNGQWFYAHVAVMCSAIALTLIGIILIVVHAEGEWLTSTDVNTPHQVLGIVATITIALNPLLALVRCKPESKWRWIYNWTHGSIGLVLGQCVGFGAMLLGLYVYRELVVDCEHAHIAIYITSTIVGVVGAVVVLYNLYTISYHKVYKKPDHKIGEEYSEIDDDLLGASEDSWLRVVVGVVIIVVLACCTMATVTFIVLADE